MKSADSSTVRFSEGPLANISNSSGLLKEDGKRVPHLDCNRIFTILRKHCQSCSNHFKPFSPIFIVK